MPVVYSRKRLRARDPTEEPSSPKPPPSPPREQPSSSARPPSKPRKRRRLQQLHIDAGQADLSHTICKQCHLLYAPGTSDDALHRARHANTPASPTWTLRNEMLLDEDVHKQTALVAITQAHCSLPSVTRRLRKLDDFVCAQLASHHTSYANRGVETKLKLSLTRKQHASWIVILYVVKTVVRGYVHAELVQKASQATVSDDGVAEVAITSASTIDGHTMCGIRKIWIHDSCRREGLASMLTDLARTHLMYAGVVKRDRVAFTAPTTTGALFAKRYSRHPDGHILVYRLGEHGLAAALRE